MCIFDQEIGMMNIHMHTPVAVPPPITSEPGTYSNEGLWHDINPSHVAAATISTNKVFRESQQLAHNRLVRLERQSSIDAEQMALRLSQSQIMEPQQEPSAPQHHSYHSQHHHHHHQQQQQQKQQQQHHHHQRQHQLQQDQYYDHQHHQHHQQQPISQQQQTLSNQQFQYATHDQDHSQQRQRRPQHYDPEHSQPYEVQNDLQHLPAKGSLPPMHPVESSIPSSLSSLSTQSPALHQPHDYLQIPPSLQHQQQLHLQQHPLRQHREQHQPHQPHEAQVLHDTHQIVHPLSTPLSREQTQLDPSALPHQNQHQHQHQYQQQQQQQQHLPKEEHHSLEHHYHHHQQSHPQQPQPQPQSQSQHHHQQQQHLHQQQQHPHQQPQQYHHQLYQQHYQQQQGIDGHLHQQPHQQGQPLQQLQPRPQEQQLQQQPQLQAQQTQQQPMTQMQPATQVQQSSQPRQQEQSVQHHHNQQRQTQNQQQLPDLPVPTHVPLSSQLQSQLHQQLPHHQEQLSQQTQQHHHFDTQLQSQYSSDFYQQESEHMQSWQQNPDRHPQSQIHPVHPGTSPPGTSFSQHYLPQQHVQPQLQPHQYAQATPQLQGGAQHPLAHPPLLSQKLQVPSGGIVSETPRARLVLSPPSNLPPPLLPSPPSNLPLVGGCTGGTLKEGGNNGTSGKVVDHRVESTAAAMPPKPAVATSTAAPTQDDRPNDDVIDSNGSISPGSTVKFEPNTAAVNRPNNLQHHRYSNESVNLTHEQPETSSTTSGSSRDSISGSNTCTVSSASIRDLTGTSNTISGGGSDSVNPVAKSNTSKRTLPILADSNAAVAPVDRAIAMVAVRCLEDLNLWKEQHPTSTKTANESKKTAPSQGQPLPHIQGHPHADLQLQGHPQTQIQPQVHYDTNTVGVVPTSVPSTYANKKTLETPVNQVENPVHHETLPPPGLTKSWLPQAQPHQRRVFKALQKEDDSSVSSDLSRALGDIGVLNST